MQPIHCKLRSASTFDFLCPCNCTTRLASSTSRDTSSLTAIAPLHRLRLKLLVSLALHLLRLQLLRTVEWRLRVACSAQQRSRSPLGACLELPQQLRHNLHQQVASLALLVPIQRRLSPLQLVDSSVVHSNKNPPVVVFLEAARRRHRQRHNLNSKPRPAVDCLETRSKSQPEAYSELPQLSKLNPLRLQEADSLVEVLHNNSRNNSNNPAVSSAGLQTLHNPPKLVVYSVNLKLNQQEVSCKLSTAISLSGYMLNIPVAAASHNKTNQQPKYQPFRLITITSVLVPGSMTLPSRSKMRSL